MFTADVGGVSLSDGVGLPAITVTLSGEGAKDQQKTIVGWTFLDAEYLEGGVLTLNGVNADNRADLETVVSMLPTAVMAEVSSGEAGAGEGTGAVREPETEKIEVGITGWSCAEYTQDGQGNWPESGEYTFVAEPQPGYVWGTQPSVRVILGGASVYVINDRFTVDGLRYKELGPDTVQLIGYEGAKPTGTLTIPSSVNKPANGRAYTVVSIGVGAFRGCTGLTGDLIIPDTVTVIGSDAFSVCSGFTGSLSLPASITEIGSYAFYGCSGFTGSLSLPTSITEIGNSAFYGCSGFTGSLSLPDSMTEIREETFSGCSGFTGRLILPDQLNIIRENAFAYCSGFTDGLVLPAQLAEIEAMAFYGCSGFTGVLRLPASLTAIGGSTFTGCKFTSYDAADQAVAELADISGVPRKMITVNGAPYTYNDRTFISGSLRYEITGPDTVTLVGYDLSQGWPTGFLDIPGTVTEQGVFYTVTAVGAWAFSGCSGFTGELSLPDSLTEIGEGAFSGCSGFTGELSLPDSLTEIGKEAFYGCSGFTGRLTLPGALSRIEDFTFGQCYGFTGGLILPDSLTEIGMNAFNGCRGLTGDLVFPDSITLIEGGAFIGCSGFTGGLTIPDNVTMIGEYAFDGCDRLTSAHIGRGLQTIRAGAFPAAVPLSTDSPRVQLLINEYLDRDTLTDTAWDGTEEVPDGAIATVKRDAVVDGDKRIGTEAQITVPGGVTLTVDGALTLDGDMHLSGQLIINGSISGTGTLYVYRGARVTGDVSKIRVVYCWTEETHNESRPSGSRPSSRRRASAWSGPLSYYLVPGDSISLRIPRADLQGLADAGLRLTLQCDTAKMSFAPAALRAILTSVPTAAGSVTFGARPADLSAYPAAAALIGGRPAYEFTISYPGGNGEDVPVTAAFPAGAASVMLAYTPSAWEAGGSLSMVSVDGSGNASWLDKSSYGADFASVRGGAALQQRGGVLAEVPHFSIYGVAYRPSGQVFTDTAGHWAGDDILFAAVRGLLPGTGEGLFSPDAALTRGALAAALGRLAGVDTAGYQASGSFRDVPADAYYAPYVEWAVQNHIMGGTGEKQFSPDAAVTREQLAAMMGNYAAQQGYVLQTPFAAEAYADGDQISAEALPWVIFMQRAGVLYGREGTRFAPQEAATRGEGAAALRRLIEVGIDPDAAQRGQKTNRPDFQK